MRKQSKLEIIGDFLGSLLIIVPLHTFMYIQVGITNYLKPRCPKCKSQETDYSNRTVYYCYNCKYHNENVD